MLGRASASEIFQHAPTDKPTFTLAEIKEAIPPHCFQCSVIKSFSYVVYDLAMIARPDDRVPPVRRAGLDPGTPDHSTAGRLAALLGRAGLRHDRRLGARPRVRPPRLLRLLAARQHGQKLIIVLSSIAIILNLVWPQNKL